MTAALSADVREYTWRVSQGAQERLLIPIVDADGAPFPVDGWTVDAKIKTAPGGEVLYEWPPENVVIDGPTVMLILPVPVSTPWSWLSAWFLVKLRDPNSSSENPAVSRVLQGTLLVDPD